MAKSTAKQDRQPVECVRCGCRYSIPVDQVKAQCPKCNWPRVKFLLPAEAVA